MKRKAKIDLKMLRKMELNLKNMLRTNNYDYLLLLAYTMELNVSTTHCYYNKSDWAEILLVRVLLLINEKKERSARCKWKSLEKVKQ